MATDASRSRSPLQPLGGPVPDEWVEGFASTPQARRLAEMAADRELLDRLMWAGYDGPDYDKLEERLAGYGHAVVFAWCIKGLIFARCASRGWRVEDQRRLDRDAAMELANETTTVALTAFRNEVLIPRVWDPAKGASLNTFFVGQCLKRFRDVYRRWLRENRPIPHDHTSEQASEPGPEALAVQRLAAGEALATITDPLTRDIVLLKAEGMSNDEIAELCELTLGAVKMRLNRLQMKQQARGRGDAA